MSRFADGRAVTLATLAGALAASAGGLGLTLWTGHLGWAAFAGVVGSAMGVVVLFDALAAAADALSRRLRRHREVPAHDEPRVAPAPGADLDVP